MHRRHFLIVLAGLAGISLLIACGGSNGGSATPTSPSATTSITATVTTPSANQWQVGVLFSLGTTNGAQELGVVEFLLDGVVEERQTFTSAGVSNAGYFLVKTAMNPGQHSFTARVVITFKSPQNYEFSGLGTFARGVDKVEYQCPPQRGALANGGQLTCTFTLPQ